MKILGRFKKKPKSSKEVGELFYAKAQLMKDPYRKKRLLLTAADYFNEAKDYDNAVRCLIMGNEQRKARALCVKVCNPVYMKKHSNDKNEIMSTYMACIIKCINENMLGKARQLSKELKEYHGNNFTNAAYMAINGLEHSNLMKLDKALVEVYESEAEFIEDDIRKVFINTLHNRCREYGIFRNLFTMHAVPEVCSHCGGIMNFDEEAGEAVCQYCGSKIKIT